METVLDARGERRKRSRRLPRSDWQVLIPNHHPGFIDWETYEANQTMPDQGVAVYLLIPGS
jgi:hypothetical protein